MIHLDNFNNLLANLNLTSNRPLLIGIDGRPCSGKSTLADQLIEALNAEGLFLDDFFIPQTEWDKNIQPAFPFPYFRYEEFIQGVSALAKGTIFQYQSYDWEMKKLGAIRTIDPNKIVIVEGVSVLCEKLAPYFHKKILVVSNEQNEFEMISKRENQNNLDVWKKLYLPSIDIYWKTKPWERADIVYAGRI